MTTHGHNRLPVDGIEEGLLLLSLIMARSYRGDALEQHRLALSPSSFASTAIEPQSRSTAAASKVYEISAVNAIGSSSPIHTTQFHCCDCDREVVHEQALQQHLADKIHEPRTEPLRVGLVLQYQMAQTASSCSIGGNQSCHQWQHSGNTRH